MNSSPPPDSTANQRAPALVGIALFKLGKGLVFLLLALGVYSLSDNDLPAEFKSLVAWFKLDPERRFFVSVVKALEQVTQSNMLMVAGGGLLYSLLAIVEGVGLMMHLSWACWLAIAESAIFIPLEVTEYAHTLSNGVLALLVLNVFIFLYLVVNRKRLFRHHFGPAKEELPAPPTDGP